MQLVVIGGGFGTRMKSEGYDLPKLLLNVNGKSLIENIVEEAIMEEVSKITWILGFEAEKVKTEISKVANVGLQQEVFVEKRQLGTLGALIQAYSVLEEEFCVLLGDLWVKSANLKGVFKHFLNTQDSMIVMSKATTHPEDSDLLELDQVNSVKRFHPYPHAALTPLPIGSSGVFLLRKEIIPQSLPLESKDIAKSLLPSLIKKQDNVRAIFHQGVIRDVGTPNRFKEASQGLNMVSKLNDKTAIFFDRDGTLNVEKGYIKEIDQVELIPGIDKVLKMAKRAFNFCGLLTNQPIIARGEATINQVIDVNARILEIAELEMNYFDVVEICPHHPDRGFRGEVEELKIDCLCRKPYPGMLLEAARKLSIRLTNCIYVGNTEADLIAAERVLCRWIHIKSKEDSECAHNFGQNLGICLDAFQLFEYLREMDSQ
jgi:D,D-heptose 1,7-bisphosphate phosphatase